MSVLTRYRTTNDVAVQRLCAVSVGCLSAFVAVSVAVRLGWFDPLDRSLAQWARPDAVWGPRQQALVHVVFDFRPTLLAVVLSVLVLGVSISRRSLRPVLVSGTAAAAAVAVALVTKYAVGRPDVQGNFYNHGSFPSGHALGVVLASGLALLVLFPVPRWWHLVLPLVPGLVMATCLVVIGMHWATDALGSILLGVAALAAAGAASRVLVRSRR